MSEFGLNANVLKQILEHARPMGHNETSRDLNLGFGFIYYGVVRALRPKHILVIGSGYGFSVVCLALALKDNGAGCLTFVDPSYSLAKDGPLKTFGGRNTWNDECAVAHHFSRFGVENIVTHHKMRSDQFFEAYPRVGLPSVDVAFIDGNHAFAEVKHDFLQVIRQSRKNTYVFLHDTNIYIRELIRHAGVKRWLRVIQREEKAFEAVDFPFASGVALVRVVDPSAWERLH
jgi:hypothetical protein